MVGPGICGTGPGKDSLIEGGILFVSGYIVGFIPYDGVAFMCV